MTMHIHMYAVMRHLSVQGRTGPDRAVHASVNAYLTVILMMYESKEGGIHPLVVALVQ